MAAAYGSARPTRRARTATSVSGRAQPGLGMRIIASTSRALNRSPTRTIARGVPAARPVFDAKNRAEGHIHAQQRGHTHVLRVVFDLDEFVPSLGQTTAAHSAMTSRQDNLRQVRRGLRGGRLSRGTRGAMPTPTRPRRKQKPSSLGQNTLYPDRFTEKITHHTHKRIALTDRNSRSADQCTAARTGSTTDVAIGNPRCERRSSAHARGAELRRVYGTHRCDTHAHTVAYHQHASSSPQEQEQRRERHAKCATCPPRDRGPTPSLNFSRF
jgi:hypothetical protein